MNTNALALLALLAGPAHADTWITEQITVILSGFRAIHYRGSERSPGGDNSGIRNARPVRELQNDCGIPELRCRCADGDRQLFRSRRNDLH